jgi:hypothetical protein
VTTSGFVLLALELCVFDKDLAVLAPVFWLENVRFVRSVRARCTCRGFPVLRHGGSCCVWFATAAAKPSWRCGSRKLRPRTEGGQCKAASLESTDVTITSHNFDSCPRPLFIKKTDPLTWHVHAMALTLCDSIRSKVRDNGTREALRKRRLRTHIGPSPVITTKREKNPNPIEGQIASAELPNPPASPTAWLGSSAISSLQPSGHAGPRHSNCRSGTSLGSALLSVLRNNTHSLTQPPGLLSS